MPRAGIYEYPARSLDDCLMHLSKAFQANDKRSLSREDFAEGTGLSWKTGPFGLLVGAMSIFHLIETGEREIRLTDITKKILRSPIPEEIAKLKENVVMDVGIVRDYALSFGNQYSESNLRYFLHDGARLQDPDEVDIVIRRFGKVLRQALQYVSVSHPEGSIKSGLVSEPKEAYDRIPVTHTSISSEKVTYGSSDDFGVWVKRDLASINFLLGQLRAVQSWLEHERSKMEEVTKSEVR